MSGGHAVLAPSAAKRWMACPGSVRLSQGVKDNSSAAADQGTAAHDVLAQCLRDWSLLPHTFIGRAIKTEGMATEVTFTAEDAASVLVARNNVAETLQGLAKAGHKHRLLIETKVYPGAAFEPSRRDECNGTADIIIIGGGVLRVRDYKHGAGVFVPADDPQLLLYGLGGMRECTPPEAQRIETTVIQPRYHGADPVRSAVWMPEQMADFRDRVSFAATRALEHPDPPLVPGEDQCRFCPAKGQCPALAKTALDAATGVFQMAETLNHEPPAATNWHKDTLEPSPENLGRLALPDMDAFTRDPDSLDPEVLSGILEAEPVIRGWLDAVHKHAHSIIKAGGKVPGFKLVKGQTRRSWSSTDGALQVLSGASRTKASGGGKLKKADYLVESLLSPAQAEKQLKPILSEKTWEKVSGLISKGTGAEVIAPVTDTRPEVITNPSEVFTPVDTKGEQPEAAKPTLDFLS